MTRIDADKIAMFGAQVFMQYGHQLLTIAGAACNTQNLPNAGPIAAALNQVQDDSFRLGLLAGMRLDQDPVVRKFLEEQVEQIEHGQVTIPGALLRNWLPALADLTIVSCVWDSAGDQLKLVIMGENAPLAIRYGLNPGTRIEITAVEVPDEGLSEPARQAITDLGLNPDGVGGALVSYAKDVMCSLGGIEEVEVSNGK